MKRQPVRYTLLLSMALSLATGLAACGSNHNGGGGGGGGGGVNGAPTVAMTTTALNGAVPGQSFTLTWSSTGSGACAATSSDNDPTWDSSNVPDSGSASVTAPTTGTAVTYTITCVNADGTGHYTITEAINQNGGGGTTSTDTPVSGSSSAVAVAPGGSFTLTWTSGASSCTASGGDGGSDWTGSVTASGSAKLIAPAAAGTYNYVLNCANADSTTSAFVFTEMVGAVPSPTVVISAAPGQVTPGATFALSWSTSDATSCPTASSNDSLGDWTKGVSPYGGSVNLAAPTTPGTYTYTLGCDGPNSASDSTDVGSATASVTVTATPTEVQAAIGATQASIPADGKTTSSLEWNSSNATTCMAGDNWTGAGIASQATVGDSGSQTVGPFQSGVNVVYPYVLTCTNTTGVDSSTAFISVGTPPAPSTGVTLGKSSIASSAATTLTWTSTNATACTAYGSWSGTVPVEGAGSTGTLGAGIYSYALLCSGPEGSSASDAILTVSTGTTPPPAPDCGLGNNTVALVAPAATVTVNASTTCLGCGTTNQGNVVDTDLTNYAAVSVPIGLLDGAETLTVTNNATITPGSGGELVGFLLSVPKSDLTLSLLQNIAINTMMNSSVVESSNSSSLLKLDLLMLLGDPTKGYLNFIATQPYNGLQLSDGSLVSLLEQVNVYAACVAQ